MSAPLSAHEPGRTEMSFGTSRFSDARSDYQTGRNLPWQVGEDKRDVQREIQALNRSDPTNAVEDLVRMPYVNGNPDMYGPDEPMVKERVQRCA